MSKPVHAPPADASAEVYDVLIVGAGISGINAAYRLQESLPRYKYTILEARDGMGGTWDLFRYPGIRSDSDLHTFGFQWNPWNFQEDIAQGENIRRYIKSSAAQYGIDKRIRYRHRVLAANWVSAAKQWVLTVEVDGVETEFRTRFLQFCTGYYDYHHPMAASIPGLENFKGQVVHPQFWPEDLDYTDKRVSIVGSGATAITLLPVVAQTAKSVTMVQRSPGYVISLPAVSPSNQFFMKWLPKWISWKVVRLKNLLLSFLFFKFCRAYPAAARRSLRRRTRELLPPNFPLDPHFQPNYNPWEQRLCVCPDEDYFACLRSGKADIVTGIIQDMDSGSMTVRGARASDPSSTSESTTMVDSDIIVTATGLKLQLGGGTKISIDGEHVDPAQKFLWKNVMMQDVPNAALTMGYTNASWTLGADVSAIQVCRILKRMQAEGKTVVQPTVNDIDKPFLHEASLINLKSTYLQKGRNQLPKAGNIGPWQPRVSYLSDIWSSRFGDIKRGLQLF